MSTPDPILVGFDLDGVILDHTTNKIRLAARYGVHLTPPETHAERMGSLLAPEAYREIKAELYNAPGELEHSTLMQGAFDGLATLRDYGVAYALISLQQNPIHAQHLLEHHGLWGTYFTPENMFFAKNGEEKSRFAGEIGVTHFVDDEANILALMPHIAHRILFDSFDQFTPDAPVVRVRNWTELTAALIEA